MMRRVERSTRGPAIGVLAVVASVLGFVFLAGSPVVHAQASTRQVSAESLIFDLKNPDATRRRDAATQLGLAKIQRATPDLVAAAADPDASVRRAIVDALRAMADIRALAGFITLSNDPERDIRDKAIEGMTNLYLPQESGLVVTLNKVATFLNPLAADEAADAIIEPDLTADPGAIEALQARMDDPESGLRTKAARALGILRGKAAVPALVRVLSEDRNNTVRFEAARSLRKIGDSSVGPDLTKLVTYTEPKVRNEVIYTIGRLRYRAAVPELTRLYEKESALPAKKIDKVYQERLLGAIAFIGEPASKALLGRYKGSADPAIRLHAFEGLGRIADPAMVTELSSDRLKEKDPKIQTAQAFGLYQLGRKEYLAEVVKALGTKRTNEEAHEYLIELKPAELPDLYAQATNPDENIREGIADVLGLCGDQQSIPTLRDLMRDDRGQIASLAAQAIRRINARTGA